jgi:hypothetical protein
VKAVDSRDLTILYIIDKPSCVKESSNCYNFNHLVLMMDMPIQYKPTSHIGALCVSSQLTADNGCGNLWNPDDCLFYS